MRICTVDCSGSPNWCRILSLEISPSRCDQMRRYAEVNMTTGCSTCDGSGKVLAYKIIEQFCPYCGGTGEVIMPANPARQRGRRAHKVAHGSSPCPTCRGRGRAPTRTLVQVNCDACQGKGQIWSEGHVPDGQSRRRSPGFPMGRLFRELSG